jgi:SAM-dependent methyltransferase
MAAQPDTYTHGHHESVLRSHRWRTAENSAGYLLSHLNPGVEVLDVGCGPGTITLDFARLVAPGRVVGVDNTDEPLHIAREADGPANVEFRAADVYALPFADDSFDVVHAHQVLQHLTDPVAAFREMRRVCRTGGVVAARDADYATMSWFPDHARLDTWLGLYHRVARSNDAYPDGGRRLLSWARSAGFEDITSTATAWCFATPEERAWWGGLWADRVLASSFAYQALDRGMATQDTLDGISRAWHEWAAEPDAWFAMLHGEVLCRA